MRSILILLGLGCALSGCSTVFSRRIHEVSKEERLKQFPSQSKWPLRKEVRVSFNENMIPFVSAQTDEDCAFAIGVVHAYLRLGQMELFKRASAGRISEVGGPFGTSEIDALLRKLDLGKAHEKSLAMLQSSERVWLDRYIEGINFYIRETHDLPYEFSFLNYMREFWTPQDAFRISRLGGADVNWATLLKIPSLRNQKGFAEYWESIQSNSERASPSVAPADVLGLEQVLSASAKTGSNSFVVGRSKSQSGSGMIASDPHLGIFAPNLWLLMGYRCPSYQVVGYMLPGVPVVTLGRNEKVAWGGTYMKGISSHLFAVRPDQIVGKRKEVIHRRGWFSKTIEIEESIHGPVIDQRLNPTTRETERIALSWVGHQPSDEIGAFLRANRARNFREFREAFRGFGVSGLNLTYADREGHVGLIPAIGQPLLKYPAEGGWPVKSADNAVIRIRRPLELPYSLNPPQGFIVSANNPAVKMEPPLALSLASGDRWRRISKKLSEKPRLALEDLKNLQLDVYSEDSHRLNNIYLESGAIVPLELRSYWKRLEEWDGQFDVNSVGAPAFEILTYQIALDLVERLKVSALIKKATLTSDDWRLFVEKELQKMTPADRNRLVMDALSRSNSAQSRFQNWGQMHVQKVQTPLGLIPFFGSRFRFFEYPAPGSATTVNKGNFSPGFTKREVVFGAQSRHVTDLASLDENYFVQLGGNDGALKAPQLLGQVPLWRQGQFLKIPLSESGVATAFRAAVFRLKEEKPEELQAQ